MSDSSGRNHGITGATFDLPGQNAKFQCEVFGHSHGLQVSGKERKGRGDGKFGGTFRPILTSGYLQLTARLSRQATPLPTSFEGATGTVTIQYATGDTEAISVTVIKFDEERSDKTKDEDILRFACRINSMPTFTWAAGTQPTVTAPTRIDQVQREGTKKALDPKGLKSWAIRHTDVWGNFADTDSGEFSKIASMVSAAQPPFAGMKLRESVFERDSDDGGAVREQWGLTDTAEDFINANTVTLLDFNHVVSGATTAAIGSVPGPPAGDDFVFYSQREQKLVDGKIGVVVTWHLRDSIADIENPGTKNRLDPYDLTSTAQETKVNKIPAATRSGLQKILETTEVSNPNITIVSAEYGKDNSKQKVEQQNTYTVTDPQGIDGSASTAAVDGTPPPLPTGFVERETLVRPETHDHSVTILRGGKLNTRQEREYAATGAEADPTEYLKFRHATVVPSAEAVTCEIYAAARFATLRADPQFAWISVRQIRPALKEEVIHYDDSEKSVRLVGWRVGYREYNGIPGVYVAEVKTRGSGVREVLLKPSRVQVVNGTIIVRRRRIASQLGDGITFRALLGASANATFLGFPGSTIIYAGFEVAYSYALDGANHLFAIDHIFQYDSMLWLDDSRIPCGRFVTAANIPSPGYYTATTIDSSFFATFPAQAALSAILA